MKESFKINHIPATVWGEKSTKVFIAVHGNMSHKEDTVIQYLADEAMKLGYQVLSFDLPEHGERKEENIPCKVQICVEELTVIMNYARRQWEEISLFSCSMGAYFSLLAYQDEKINQALFLSPVVDMRRVIENMMVWFQVTPEILQEKKIIDTSIGQKLYWDYYCYVKENSINKWEINTAILYGENDDLCEVERIKNFVETFECDIKIMENGEHFFHTKEQLKVFRDWLGKQIKK